MSLLSRDGNEDNTKCERPRERPERTKKKTTATPSNDAGRTTDQRQSELPRPTQERIRSLPSSLSPKTGGDDAAASPTAAASMRPTTTRSRSNMRQRPKLRLPHLLNMNLNSDDISVTDSICSGVIREFANAKALARTTMSKIESKISNIENKIVSNSVGSDGARTASTTKTTSAATAHSHVNSSNSPVDPSVGRGEVIDVIRDISLPVFDRTNTTDTNISSMRTNSSQGVTDDDDDDSHDDIMRDIVVDDEKDNDPLDVDGARLSRQTRKERVRERLVRYKRDHGRLQATCVTLEALLVKTSSKLREVDSKAAIRIEALESEVREAREKGETTRTSQEACIKELGKKLIRQAHVIKGLRNAAEQYKIQLEAMAEEMAMQDERDSRREEDVRRLEDMLENSRDGQDRMQAMLQENIEEMVELKSDVERDAKNIMELEYNLGQKEAMLNRVARDLAEKTERICELEQQLEDKTFEVDSAMKQLVESKESAEVMRQQFEAAAKEIEDMKCNFTGWGESKTTEGANEEATTVARSPHSWKRASHAKVDVTNKNNKPSSLADDDDIENNMKEAFASELQAKDATIRTLDEECKEKDMTINALRSDMVKMSSTYKQDSYLKRKEIAKLKQQNAEFALKLRALEKAFQCVNATGNMTTVETKDGTKFLSHSTHGGGVGSRGDCGGHSLHIKSLHSESHSSKEGKAAAVSARLGGTGQLRSLKVVQQANFFDDDAASDRGTSSGGKGEDPEEQ
ncbi:hypothetical protein ACHAXA_006981 [Cyclostephanos tholiformis]|uniref:Uncharacterized protein n=1 Tax=Cyclostephanos tholiformis TaxID=382380 RepID=A0ABD3RXF8_9STRA